MRRTQRRNDVPGKARRRMRHHQAYAAGRRCSGVQAPTRYSVILSSPVPRRQSYMTESAVTYLSSGWDDRRRNH